MGRELSLLHQTANNQRLAVSNAYTGLHPPFGGNRPLVVRWPSVARDLLDDWLDIQRDLLVVIESRRDCQRDADIQILEIDDILDDCSLRETIQCLNRNRRRFRNAMPPNPPEDRLNRRFLFSYFSSY